MPDAEKGFPPPDEEGPPGEILRISETMAGTKQRIFANRIGSMYNKVRKHFAIAGPYQPVSFHVVASWFRHHHRRHLTPADYELLMDDIANWEDWSHAESPFKTAKTLSNGPRRIACLTLADEAPPENLSVDMGANASRKRSLAAGQFLDGGSDYGQRVATSDP